MEVHIRGRYKWDGAGEGREICPRAKPLSTSGRARRKQGRALRRAPGTQAGRRGRGTSPYVSRVSVEAGGLGERRMLGLWPGTWLWNENVTSRAEAARGPCAVAPAAWKRGLLASCVWKSHLDVPTALSGGFSSIPP